LEAKRPDHPAWHEIASHRVGDRQDAFIQRLSGERAAQHYAAIVESSTDAILSKDLNGSSRAGTAVPNFSLATRRRKRWGSRSPLIPVDRHDEEPFILGRIRQGESVDHYETIRLTKDGRLIDISLTVSPIKNESGEIIGASKIARDISESKRAQERL
jgi:PAS domain-containing protein